MLKKLETFFQNHNQMHSKSPFGSDSKKHF